MRMHCALIGLGVASSLAMAQATVVIGDSTENWIGWMNVVDEVNPGDAWGSGWGVPDLTATFDDGAGSLTMEGTTIDDSNEYWYYGALGDTNPGGPGALGRKIMEANLYQEYAGGGVLTDTAVNFSGNLLSNSFSEHTVNVFIKQFTPDWSSWSGTVVELTSTGAFSIDYTTDAGTGAVQFGIQVIGRNSWSTDTAAFGNAVFAVPSPASAALLGLGGLVAIRRRR